MLNVWSSSLNPVRVVARLCVKLPKISTGQAGRPNLSM
ncbi:hypothetical protein EMIT0373P_60043 [Pseudomonas chlororaphis]